MELNPKTKINKRTNFFIGLVLFITAFVIYFMTKPASLSFWDCGEYITCCSILGVPHPPGNPFYIILGKFFTLLPLGFSDAQSVSLLSIVFSSFSVLFVYLSIVKLVAIWKTKPFYAHLAGIIGALFIAFSSEFWVNALEAEVYGGLSFFITLIIWLSLVWTEKQKNFDHQGLLLLIIFLFFLGFGVHQTTLQIVPAILLIIAYPLIDFNKEFIKKVIIYFAIALALYFFFYSIGKSFDRASLGKYIFALFTIGLLIYYFKPYVQTKVWFFALFMVILGLSTHLFLPIRAATHTFINEGDPSNWQRFMDYVFRKQYGPTSFFVRRAPIAVQFNKHFFRYFSWQFFDAETIANVIPLAKQTIHFIFQFITVFLGISGIYYQFKKSKRSFIYLASLFFMASIAMILVMNLQVDEVRDRPYFFMTAYMLWAFWMGIGSIGIIRYLRKRIKIIGHIALVILILLPVVNMTSHYHKNDRSEELLALEYGQNFLNGLDKNAIIFTNGDNDTFPLWYAQAVYDPYAEEYMLEQDTLKFREIKGQSISEKKELSPKTKRMLKTNYEFKKDLEGIRKDVSVANLSLLNTPWYIKQLRDFEGININLSDKAIDNLRPLKLSRDVSFTVDSIVVNFKEGDILYIRDQMVLQIIKDNYGKRPIYFAVTVADKVGFDKYLKSEGMADRLVSTKGKYQIDAKRLKHNIENVFDFTSVYNEDLYKDKNMKRLMNNYGANFMSMANVLHQKGREKDAIKYFKKSLDFVDNKERFIPSLAQLYYTNGEYDEAYNVLKPVLEKEPGNQQLIYLASQSLSKAGKADSALSVIESSIPFTKDSQHLVKLFVDIAKEHKKYDRALKFIDEELQKDRDNKRYQDFKKQLQELSKE
ncbi:MAG: DUF2723 domain-containing protein [Candidatus Cloacimonetes bacterium]|nr:DUF2723 domain-containing protein [Candidatus Cloacimonadota bacterium]MBS3766868.1 DUF2723 domain-containing protein [Candidatus Cloacimonadota bacterium]